MSLAFLLLKECEPLSPKSAFSYHCQGCAQCCLNKRIPVIPLDVFRLARFLGLASGDFIEKFVDTEQAFLKHKQSGGCIFLENKHCTVYPARPLVCCLYPLLRQNNRSHGELYALAEPEPDTAGRYGTAVNIESFIKSQGADRLLVHLDHFSDLRQRFPDLRERRWLDLDTIISGHTSRDPIFSLKDWEQAMEVYYSVIEGILQASS